MSVVLLEKMEEKLPAVWQMESQPQPEMGQPHLISAATSLTVHLRDNKGDTAFVVSSCPVAAGASVAGWDTGACADMVACVLLLLQSSKLQFSGIQAVHVG
jgi:hypothetical protein